MEILLVLAAVAMFVVTVVSLSQIGRPYTPPVRRVEAPWQPTWLAVTPQEMWMQSLEREVHYGRMTATEAIDALQTGLRSTSTASISGNGNGKSEPGE